MVDDDEAIQAAKIRLTKAFGNPCPEIFCSDADPRQYAALRTSIDALITHKAKAETAQRSWERWALRLPTWVSTAITIPLLLAELFGSEPRFRAFWGLTLAEVVICALPAVAIIRFWGRSQTKMNPYSTYLSAFWFNALTLAVVMGVEWLHEAYPGPTNAAITLVRMKVVVATVIVGIGLGTLPGLFCLVVANARATSYSPSKDLTAFTALMNIHKRLIQLADRTHHRHVSDQHTQNSRRSEALELHRTLRYLAKVVSRSWLTRNHGRIAEAERVRDYFRLFAYRLVHASSNELDALFKDLDRECKQVIGILGTGRDEELLAFIGDEIPRVRFTPSRATVAARISRGVDAVTTTNSFIQSLSGIVQVIVLAATIAAARYLPDLIHDLKR